MDSLPHLLPLPPRAVDPDDQDEGDDVPQSDLGGEGRCPLCWEPPLASVPSAVNEKLLYACERAHRNALATMGPRADLTRCLAEAIAEARGA